MSIASSIAHNVANQTARNAAAFERVAAETILRVMNLPDGESPTAEDADVLAQLMTPGGLCTDAMRCVVDPPADCLSPSQLDELFERLRAVDTGHELVAAAKDTRDFTKNDLDETEIEIRKLRAAHRAIFDEMDRLVQHRQRAKNDMINAVRAFDSIRSAHSPGGPPALLWITQHASKA